MPTEWGDAAKKLMELADKFLTEIVVPPIKPPLEEIGQLSRDHIRYWRFQNQIKILNKASEQLNKVGLSPKKIPSKLLVPLLENGSLEDDENMIERWANLLANAVNPDSSINVNAGIIETLKQLTPKEAYILDIFHDYYITEVRNETRGNEEKSISLRTADLYKMCNLEVHEYESAIDNLIRLDLFGHNAILFSPPQGEYYYSSSDKLEIKLTRFGLKFIAACKSKYK